MTNSDCSLAEERSRHRHKKSKKSEKAIEERFSKNSSGKKTERGEKEKREKGDEDALVSHSTDYEASAENKKQNKRKRKEEEEIVKIKSKKKQRVNSDSSERGFEKDVDEKSIKEIRNESRRKNESFSSIQGKNKDRRRNKEIQGEDVKRRRKERKQDESFGEKDPGERSVKEIQKESTRRRDEIFDESTIQEDNPKERRNESRRSDDSFDERIKADKDEGRKDHTSRGDFSYGSDDGGKPYRYWSSSRGPIRKNSDSYWNKYSDRLKESFDHMEVGPRYYASGDDRRKEKRSSTRRSEKENQKDVEKEKEVPPKETEPPKPKKAVDILSSRTGGAYIPPAKLRMMQESITDKSSAAYQRLAWEALKKSIQGHVNKVNTSNLRVIWRQVLKENIVRGKGLLCRALIQAQAASPSFTNVYASLAAILNAKFPKIGELLLKRLVVQFRRGFKRNDKSICITAVTFIAHLVNQEMAHEIIALEILTLLIESPTDDSIEVAIAFLKESGMKLNEVSRKGLAAIFDMLRNILHEGKLEKRVQYMIEVMFQIRKEEFKAHPSVLPELSLVDEDDRIQHMITLEENHDPEDILNVFRLDPDYEANEAKYKSLVVDELDSGDDEDDSGGSDGSGESDSGSEDEEDGVGGEGGGKKDVIVDKTETNLVALRKTIYLTIQSSLDFEECAHKLLRMELKPGQEIEMAHMFLDCCAEQRTYEKFFGLLAQRFCQINRVYIAPFEQTFRDSYETIHRMSNDKLRNVGKLFAHLLFTDAISWDVLAIIRLNEDETTSSSRIFIKILFLELSEYMGLAKLNQRVKDPALQTALEGLFPRDNPKHTRFAINFFTSIGLGGLTDELREHLKSQPKPAAVPQLVEDLSSTSSSSSSDSSSESSDSSESSSSSSSSDSSSDSEDNAKKRKGKGKQKEVTPKKKQTTPKKDKSKPPSKSSSSKTKSKDNSSSRRKRDR